MNDMNKTNAVIKALIVVSFKVTRHAAKWPSLVAARVCAAKIALTGAAKIRNALRVGSANSPAEALANRVGAHVVTGILIIGASTRPTTSPAVVRITCYVGLAAICDVVIAVGVAGVANRVTSRGLTG